MADASYSELIAPADALASRNGQTNVAYAMVFNGTTWDQVREATADALAVTGLRAAALMGYNGATWDRVRTANTGRLQVDVITGGGGSITDEAAWTAGTSSLVGTGGVFNDSAAALTSGQIGTFRSTAQRAQHVVLRNVANTAMFPDSAALADATTNPTLTGLGAYEFVFNGTTWDRARSGGVTGMRGVSGDIANAATDSGNPLKIGGYASTTSPTAVTAGQRANAWFGLEGQLAVQITDKFGNAPVNTNSMDSDAYSQSNAAMWVLAGNALYNGSTWDRHRSGGVTGMAGVSGDTASGATDAGNPVKVGGVGSTTSPTPVTAGQRQNLWLALSGAARVTLIDDSNNKALLGPAADGDNIQTNVRLFVDSSLALYRDSTHSDVGRSISALDAAPNVDTGILAVGTGPGWDRKQNPAGVAATSTANAVTITVDGADVIILAVTTIGTTPGSMIIETSNDDGTTWTTSGSVYKLVAELWVQGSFVPAVGDQYMVRTTGLRQIRYRVNATYASGTATIKWTGSTGVALIKAMDGAPQPHNIGQTILNYQSASLGVVTSQVAVAATAAKQVYVTHVRVSVGGTTAGSIAIYSGTGAFTEGTSQTVFFAEFAPSTTSKPGAIVTFAIPWNSATVNQDIRITTVGLTATHVGIQYYVSA